MPAPRSAALLSGPQVQAAQALLSGHTVVSAARACGVSERTIRAWKNEPAFREFLLHGQSELLEESRGLLCVAAAEAIKALVEVAQDPVESGAARVSAARALLGFALNSRLPEAAPAGLLPAAPSSRGSESTPDGRGLSCCAIADVTPAFADLQEPPPEVPAPSALRVIAAADPPTPADDVLLGSAVGDCRDAWPVGPICWIEEDRDGASDPAVAARSTVHIGRVTATPPAETRAGRRSGAGSGAVLTAQPLLPASGADMAKRRQNPAKTGRNRSR